MRNYDRIAILKSNLEYQQTHIDNIKKFVESLIHSLVDRYQNVEKMIKTTMDEIYQLAQPKWDNPLQSLNCRGKIDENFIQQWLNSLKFNGEFASKRIDYSL